MESNNILKNEIIKIDNIQLKRKNKIEGIIFARSCCSIGIVIFHYFCHSNGTFKFLYRTANTSFGFLFVISFFCISGTVLFHNYPKTNSIKVFYFKRWKSIFPSFYLCYLYFYLRNIFRYKKQIFKWTLLKFFITFFGLDGYLSHIMKTCYLVGEWFLGALIIIYLLYPLLSFIFNYSEFLFCLILLILNFFMYKTNLLIYGRTINLITCLTNFSFGILAIKYNKIFLNNIKALNASLFLFILLCFMKFPSILILSQIQGFALFIFLVNLGRYIMICRFNKLFIELGNLSYSIFLYQHQIIRDILSVKNPYQWYFHLILLLLTIVLIIICSKIHLMVVYSIFKSYTFNKIESLFIFN